MVDHRDDDRGPDRARRKLLQAGAIGAGALAAGHLPWERPEVKSFFGVRSAWAQTSFLQIVMEGRLGTSTPGTSESTGQDLWEFEVFVSPTQLTITAESLDGFIDPELFLYLPGAVGAGENNLLTGTPFAFNMAGTGATESTTVTVATTLAQRGIYSLAIESALPPASEVAGDYRITVDANQPVGPPSQVIDEGTESDRSG